MFEKRVEKLSERILEANAEAAVIFTPEDICYFTGLKGVEGVLVITAEKKMRLFVTPLYENVSKDVLKEDVYITKEIMSDVSKYMEEEGIHSVGLDFLNTKVQYYEDLSLFDIKDFTNQTKILRMIKDKNEINNIKRASIAARNAFMKVYPYMKVGMSEKELADELTYQIRKAGAQRESFETIAASGANAANPHHIPSNKKIEDGEFVVIDFGAYVDGYNSDNTLTFLMGKRDDEKRKLFNAVFYAQLFSTEMIIPGKTKIRELEERARKELSKYGLDKYFIHSLGHGVGLEVHEFPFINLKNDMVIQPGMVFTIEPGIYIPGKLGIRLEHMVCVTENDAKPILFTPFMEIM